jgi:outer membrane receptor protein involved in Fe transport
MFKKILITVVVSFISYSTFAQDETVTVIGSLIKGTPIDTGSPIQKIDSDTIESQGNLNIVELIKMVPGSSGVDGESNQFGSNGAEGLSNINLRGLGTQRTLVLINGKRQVTAPLSTGAGRSVNLHDIPMAALRSVEILKEGAAATYGSDAISGVVNFITDSTFEGFKANFAGKSIPDADDESQEFSLTYGTLIGDTNFVASLGYQFKGQLAARDTSYAIKPFSASDKGGWSTMGNPGTFVHPDGASNAALGLGNFSMLSDPGCNNAGGTNTALGGFGTSVAADAALAGICRYQYSYFDNVQEEQENTQLWMEANGDINGHDFHVEFLYGNTDVPHWATSPSYPPNNPASNTMPDNHPAMTQLCTDYAAFCTALINTNYGGDGTNRADIHRLRIRAMAAAGNPFGSARGAQTESREYDTFRIAGAFEGDLTDDIQYSTSLNYSTSEGETTSSDTQQHKFLSSLWGYGGPSCDVELTGLTTSTSDLTPTFKVKSTGAAIAASTVQGTSRPTGCSYYNPLSNGVQQGQQRDFTTGQRVAVNPDYTASLANTTEMLRWLIDQRITVSESTLLTADFIVQGNYSNFELDGGDAAWALGYERREYNITTFTPNRAGPTANNANTNIHNGTLYPCDIPANNATESGRAACAANPVGLFMFLAPTFDVDQDQNIDAFFGELALPINDALDMQIGLRYEDYGTDSTLDPKLVVRYSPMDSLTMRFTGQTTFRAPHPDETSNTRVTALSYVNQAGAFKGVDITGNKNLSPEEATTFNVGLVTDFGTDNWSATLDFYDFNFKNPIIFENHQQLVNAYAAGGAAKAAVQGQIFTPDGAGGLVADGSGAAGNVARIQSNYINGPETNTNGIDLFVQYEMDIANGSLAAGIEANEILEYSVAAYMKGSVQIAAAYECAGYFNIENTCRSMPSRKAKAFVSYTDNIHNVYGAVNYISSYDDRRATGAGCSKVLDAEGICTVIGDMVSVDATYTYTMDDQFDLSLSVYNMLDEMPPFTVWEMNYDPNTHSPLGRFIKAGFTYRMQ